MPAGPPPAPTVNYQGRTTSAVLDDVNVGALADAGFGAMVLGLDAASASLKTLRPGETDETVNGPAGGTARLLGRMNPDGTGWFSATYLSYGDGKYTINGTQVNEIVQVNSDGVWISKRVSYHDLDIALAQRRTNYSGSMTFTRGSQGTATAAGTIRLRNGAGELMASGLVLTLKGIEFGTELGATGRVFDSTHGWFDLSLAAPWVIARDEGFPAYGGPMVGATEDGRAFRLVSLTPDIVSLQYAAAATDRFDRAARLAWGWLFESQTARATLSTPVADAGPSNSVPPGARVTLEGGYSSQAENAFLRYEWTLLFRPPGSSATLDHANDISPAITLDAPGRYLLQVVVNDGIRSSKRDVVAVAADARADTDPSVFSVAQLPPSRLAALGSTVNLDSMITPRGLPIGSSVAPPIQVWGPHGDTLPTTQVGSALTFVAADPGVYKAVLGGTLATVSKGVDTQYFSVLADANFTPGVWVPVADLVNHLLAADINGDGRSDLIASEDAQLEVFFGAPQPDFRGPVVLNGVKGASVAVGDLTGDGRADIATPVSSGLGVFAQNPDGFSFAPVNVLANACGAPDEPVVIGDVNGDGRNDVVVGCYLDIAYYLGRVDGTFDPLRTIAVGRDFELAAGDFNNDGFADLVVAAQHAPNIGILNGQAGTAPEPLQWLSLVAQSHDRIPQLAIANLNADARQDLVFGGRAFGPNTDHDKLRIFHQDGSGQLVEAQIIDSPYPRRALNDVSIGDFNHDGAVDVGVHVAAPFFAAHYQITPGRFGDQARAALDCTNQTAGDFNADGLTDVACAAGSTVQAAVMIMFGERPSAPNGHPPFF